MERATKWTSTFVSFFLLMILAYILGDIVFYSLGEIDWRFISQPPSSAGRKGGIFPIIVSTFAILGVCLAIVVPIGLATAFYLADNKNLLLVRKAVEILSGVPSIVFGLFGNALFSVYLGMGFSILSGGLTLAIMALPLFITTIEKGISSVPLRYHHIGHSLGLSKITMMMTVVLPYVLPSIIVGMVLSIGRALAETAALIFTSGYVDRMPESILDSGRALSVHIYDLTMNVPGGNLNAYKSSFVLIVLILVTNGIVNGLLKVWYRKRIAL